MRRMKKYLLSLMIALIACGGSASLVSCGSIHSYWGLEGDYDFADNGYHNGHYKHKKNKKHKKHKKHHHHHHDHDDDDD